MANVRHRVIGSLTTCVVVILLGALPAVAGMGGSTLPGGTRLTFKDRIELKQIRAAAAASKAGPRFEYASVADCGNNSPDSANPDDLCRDAALACAGNTPEQGLGPSVRLFRRPVNAAGAPTGPWVQYGITCFPEDAPGPVRPRVTMAMVLAAFHDTDFAKPTLDVQPRGNVTLVTLPTYFQTSWPPERVRAGGDRPRSTQRAWRGSGSRSGRGSRVISYDYGDGSTSGATTSLGGPYPEGDITRTYTRAGDFTVRADVTYSGQFRVNGGQWIDIPGDVTIRGTAENLTVKTAHARLVSH